MDHHLVETLEEATAQGMHRQQQVVRIKAAAAELVLQARSSRGRGLVVVPPRTPKEDGADDEEEEEMVVEEKVALLRRLVPGGEGMPVEGLLEETADYIAALKAQVGVMRALACLLSGSGLVDALPEKHL